MKNRKVIKLLITLLLVSALVFTGCANNNTPDKTGNNTENQSSENNNAPDNDAEEPTPEDESTEDEKTSEEDKTSEDEKTSEEEDTEEPVVDSGLARADVPEDFKWDLQTLYASRDAFMLDLSEAELLVAKLENSSENFTSSYDNFISTLTTFEEASRLINKLYVFATLQSHTDTTDTAYSELVDLANAINNDVSEKTAYLMPAIVHLDEETLASYLDMESAKPYISFIDSILEEKDHILTDNEEKILGQAQVLSDVPEAIYEAYKYQTDIESYLPEPAWEKFYTGTGEEKQAVLETYFEKTSVGINLIAEIYESEIKKNTFFAQARNYDSALESALTTDGVTRGEYDKIFEITHDNLDILHRWIDLKQEILDIDEPLVQADLYAPIIAAPPAYMSYEDGQTFIFEALKPLGKQYIEDLKDGFNSRWVDVYPTSNKYEGGYQWGTYDTEPFVLLNYNDTMTDVSTAAHEMGHALNAKYSNANQSYFNAGVTIFNAEIASTTNESLVFEYRLSQAQSKDEKQQALVDYISLIENTIFSQMIFADFEKRAYEAYEAGTPLNAEVFNGIMNDVYSQYYGPNFKVDAVTSYQWAEIPHFYNAFYVYKYATGLSAGLAFSDMILNGSEQDIQGYLNYLASGSSDAPLDLLRTAGVDFSTGAPLQKAYDKFESLIDQLEETLK